MEAQFWHDMWSSGHVGFHQNEVNEYLQTHWKDLTQNGNEGVLVPLCGKSLDMIWLAQQGHEVLGVELSAQALDEFLQENNLHAFFHKTEQFNGFKLPAMTLLCGDFFDLQAEDCKALSLVYDRAALVALPPEMRQQYVQHIYNIMPSGSQTLLVTMEYDQSQLPGPPFSVAESEVMQLFKDCQAVQKVQEVNFKRKGVDAVEKVFLIKA